MAGIFVLILIFKGNVSRISTLIMEITVGFCQIIWISHECVHLEGDRKCDENLVSQTHRSYLFSCKNRPRCRPFPRVVNMPAVSPAT